MANRVFNQLATVAYLRWRMFANSLRTTRGKTELVARSFVTLAFSVGAVLGAVAMGGAAWYFVLQNRPEYIGALLWAVFLFWQLFPVMATAFTNNPDASELLRFPLSYRLYYVVRLGYGAFDPASALGCAWLFGILIGIGVASQALLPWAIIVLAAFAVFNLLFMQMVFAWVERWLAQRRTREIMGVLFVLLMLSFQLVGPTVEHLGRRSRPEFQKIVEIVAPVQRIMPPGLAADAIAQVTQRRLLAGFTSLLLLCAVGFLMAFLLHMRLRAQFHGESLSETSRAESRLEKRPRYVSWQVPGLSSSIAAVLEKELRYVLRSGPMLLTLIMPIFMVVVFRLGPMSRARAGFVARVPSMAFPIAAAYSLLVLTNLIYNNFGGDAAGIQFFYASPVRFSQIVLAKNLTHITILLANTSLSWIAVAALYGAPSFAVTIATLAALVFAAPVNLTVGNLLSLYSPKKLDFSTFGRQRAAQMTVLASLAVQIIVVGFGVSAFWLAREYGNFWIATGAFLGLSVVTISVYVFTLSRMNALALERRETLVAELCRA